MLKPGRTAARPKPSVVVIGDDAEESLPDVAVEGGQLSVEEQQEHTCLHSVCSYVAESLVCTRTTWRHFTCRSPLFKFELMQGL